MNLNLSAITLVVPDYDAAIAFYVQALGFELLEDTPLSESKRWVRVAPQTGGTSILLAKADGPEQIAAIGRQAGGRVAFFLQTDDFEQTHARFIENGVSFLEQPRHEIYGTVAVFVDPFGNSWDLIQPGNPG